MVCRRAAIGRAETRWSAEKEEKKKGTCMITSVSKTNIAQF